MTTEKMKVLDLFSGIGGFSLGLESSGFYETVAFCEVDKKATKVLAKHWPDIPVYNDVKEITLARLIEDGTVPDVITGGFPCKTSPPQAKAQGLPEQGAAFGGSSTGSSKKSNRAGRSSKTSQPFGLEDWTKCSGASLRSGMMRNGTVYPLPQLVRLTGETGSGSWPTPRAKGLIGGSGSKQMVQKMVDNGTLSATEASAITSMKMWPTPTARDRFGANGYESTLKKLLAGGRPHLGQLPNRVQLEEGRPIHGQLNPDWVEWLMGYPIGWTDLNS